MGRFLLHRDKNENPRCASCDLVDESFEHMLSCPGHAQELTQLQESMENSLISLGTPTALRSVLVCCLFDHDDCAQKVVRTVRDDCIAVGRQEIWRGRLPISATKAYQIMKKSGTYDEIERNANHWSKKVVKLILQTALHLWWFRNKKRHGNDKEEEATIRRRKALARCKELATRTTRLKEHGKFFTPFERLEKWQTGMILHYLSWAEDLCEKCEEKEKNGPRPASKWDREKGEVFDPP